MAARTWSDQNSNHGHGTTQSHQQGGELRGDEVCQSSNSSSSKIPSGTRKGGSGVLKHWASEVTALVSAIGCLTAIYIILGKFNNQQQPEWPYARTLNLSTLVALIATLLRSAVEVVLSSGIGQLKWDWFRSSSQRLDHVQTFEDASHGPWGSLVFVFSLARLNLATFGSIIMVLSVLIGTITQQAIQTVSCQRSSPNGVASLPIAHTSLKGIDSTAAGSYFLSTDLKASLIAGLAGVRQPNSFSPACPSGNCAFLAKDGFPYSTIGISSECVDISSLIVQSGRELDSWASNQNYSDLAEKPPVTTYTLLNGLHLSYDLSPGSNAFPWSTTFAQAELRGLNESGELSPQNLNLTGREKDLVFDSPWFDSIVFLMPTTNPCENPSEYYSYFSQSGVRAMPATKANSCPELNLPSVDTLPGYFSVTAAACLFYISLQRYESSVVNGVLEEKLLQNSVPFPSIHHTDQDPICSWCAFVDPCVVEGVVYTNTSANLSSVPGGTTMVGTTMVPLRCLYGLDYPWYEALAAQPELSTTIGNYDDDNKCFQGGNYTSMACSGTWWFNNMFNRGNASIDSIREVMKRGFDSLSAQLRMVGTDWHGNPTNVSGIAYDTVVCVVFRWEWLFYPLGLVVGASVLLLLLLASNLGTAKSRKHAIWKSSVLPFLFYGLEDRFRDQASHLAPQEELEGVAKTLSTSFSPGDDEWRFHNQD